MSDEAIRVKVVCRVRPLNEKERAAGDDSIVSFPSASCVALGVSSLSPPTICCHTHTHTHTHTHNDTLLSYNFVQGVIA